MRVLAAGVVGAMYRRPYMAGDSTSIYAGIAALAGHFGFVGK
jgi:hypothetical protein